MKQLPQQWQMPNHHHRALVIDDDAQFRDFLKTLLEASGFDVCCASDGESGLNLFRQLRPDIVITDIVMPNTDGITVIRKIKAAGSDVPTVAMASLELAEEEGFLSLALLQGADAVLTKPFSIDHLRSTLTRLLDNRLTGTDAFERMVVAR